MTTQTKGEIVEGLMYFIGLVAAYMLIFALPMWLVEGYQFLSSYIQTL